jgi:hypothetical protein
MSPLFFAALLAQDADRSALVRYQEVTTLEFPEQDLVGELVGPTGCVLYERKRGEFITLRRDFNAEIADSAAIIGGATGI